VASPPVNRQATPAWAGAEAALTACMILGAVLAAYSPAIAGGLLWDDDAHVTKLSLRSLHGLWRIWTEAGATQQYYPLLHSAFWVEHLLWGDSVVGYHLANIVEHSAAAWLLFVILRHLSFPAPRIAALVFALHPLCVESVAWISEQKNTLSAVFYLSSALVYLQFCETRRRNLYSWALTLFVLALLTKTVVATLPAALLVVLWWRRGRISWSDVMPLVPWFFLALGSGLFTAWAEVKFIGAEGVDFSFTFLQRILLAGRAVVFYASRVAWPGRFMFIYPRWTLEVGDMVYWMCLVGVIGFLASFVVLSRRERGPLAGMLFFTGTLFPALGFFNVYPFRFSFVADHFQYLASLGLVVPAAWAIWWLVRRLDLAGASRTCALAAVPALLGFLTWRQSGIYSSSETLYRSTIAENPSAWLMHYNLAVTLGMGPEHLSEAVSEYRTTIRLKPDHWEAHNNLASALLKMPGRSDEAIAEYGEALRYNPDFAVAHNNLGIALEEKPGRMGDAEDHLRAAIRLMPAYDAAHSNLGALLMHKPGGLDEAIGEFKAAIRIAPGMAEYHYNLANALALVPGRTDESVAEYRAALRIRPAYAEAHSNLGVTLSHMPGHLDEAVDEYRAALVLDPGSAEIHENLANILAKLPGRKTEAMEEYRMTIKLDPSGAQAHYGLGLLLAGSRGEVNAAAAEFREAVRISPDFAEAHFGLGISLAMEGGHDDEAGRELEAALQIRPDFELARGALARLRGGHP
jgi:tetratricopeptide (TPR) repeat protein